MPKRKGVGNLQVTKRLGLARSHTGKVAALKNGHGPPGTEEANGLEQRGGKTSLMTTIFLGTPAYRGGLRN